MLRILLIALTTVAFASCTLNPARDADQPNPDFAIDRDEQRFELPEAVTRLRIVNLWGDVHLKQQDGTSLQTYAVIQRIGPGALMPRIELSISGDLAELDVDYASAHPPGTSGRVDIAVYLPPLTDLEVETDHGRVRGSGIKANLKARTNSGFVLGSATGRLEIRSKSGDIRVKQIGGKWKGDAFLISESGLIELLIPPESEVRISAQTDTGISQEFGAALRVLEQDPRHLEAELGSGPAKLNVRLQSSGELLLRPLHDLR